MSVGHSRGRFLSHRHVALVWLWPYCQGWIIWSGFLMAVLILPIGFSIAILPMGAAMRARTKLRAASCSLLHQCHWAPLRARYVHGGNATIRSHPHASTLRTSPCTCVPGCSVGTRSTEHASCPAVWNAWRTIPLNSQATSTLTGPRSR